MIDAYKNICELLNRHKVEYLVIGGIAVIAHGYPRSTGDVDFWYRPTIENYLNLIAAFKGEIKFTDAYKRAKIFDLEGISIAIIGYNDLIKIKKETNRPKDLGDIDELEKRRKSSGKS